MWVDTNPVDQLQLVIHNRDAKPINLKSVRISYYLNTLVFKSLGNTHYRLAYGNYDISSPHYEIMDYKTTVNKETLTQATLGTEVSNPPKPQLAENPSNHKFLFNLTISALSLLLMIGLGLSLRKKLK